MKKPELIFIPSKTQTSNALVNELYPVNLELGGDGAALDSARQIFDKHVITPPPVAAGDENLLRDLAKKNMISPILISDNKGKPASITVVARNADALLTPLNEIDRTFAEKQWCLNPPVKKIVSALRTFSSHSMEQG